MMKIEQVKGKVMYVSNYRYVYDVCISMYVLTIFDKINSVGWRGDGTIDRWMERERESEIDRYKMWVLGNRCCIDVTGESSSGRRERFPLSIEQPHFLPPSPFHHLAPYITFIYHVRDGVTANNPGIIRHLELLDAFFLVKINILPGYPYILKVTNIPNSDVQWCL